jgi:hypothetical protein
VDPEHSLDIREILLERNISNKEKLELLRIKIVYSLKHLKGKKRIVFITTTISLLTFFLGNATPVFALFMGSLRELLGGTDDEETLRDCLIALYMEYNAPLPEELINQIILH